MEEKRLTEATAEVEALAKTLTKFLTEDQAKAFAEADLFCRNEIRVLYSLFRSKYPELIFSILDSSSKSFIIDFGHHYVQGFNAISIAVPIDKAMVTRKYIYETAIFKNDKLKRICKSNISSIEKLQKNVAKMYNIYKGV